MPEYKRYKDEKLGVVVEYTEESGKISKEGLFSLKFQKTITEK